MNVKELKEFLENLPDDAECVAYESHSSFTGQVFWQECGVSYDEQTREVYFS